MSSAILFHAIARFFARIIVRWQTTMSITEYDNAAKWAKFYKSLPRWLKSSVIIGIIAILSIWGYRQWGPVRQLKSANTDLKKKLESTESELAALRDTKNELHRENLHLKELIDPVQRKAEILYPELETAAAMAKLAEDLHEVRSLATRDVYRPLSPDRIAQLTKGLQSINAQAVEFPLTITIVVQQGSSAREKVAADLKRYIQRAGITVKKQSAMLFSTGTLPDISIKMHPEDLTVAEQFASVIGTLFINKQFAGTKKDKFVRGQIEIQISGDPLFTDTGIVTFK